MHSYLITGHTKKGREEKKEDLARKLGGEQTITLETEKSHTIEDVRNLQKKLSLASSSQEKPRLVIIKDAHLLTSEAANAFLKTLEEPPGNTIIILTSPSRELVLETIASRAQLVDLGPQVFEVDEKDNIKAHETFDKLINGSVGERLKFLEGIKDREEALKFCALQIVVAREKMIKDIATEETGVLELLKLIERIESAREDIQNNVNVKLALGDLLLNYP